MSNPTNPSYDALQSYVRSAAFDNDCAERDRIDDLLGKNDLDYSYEIIDIESSSTDIYPHHIPQPELESYLYYCGIRQISRRGPKLIFRTSKDVFKGPSGSHGWVRDLRVLPVYEHDKLGKDNLWDVIRSKVVALLDQRNIRHSSVDLARFGGNKRDWSYGSSGGEESGGGENDLRIDVAPVITTPVTIWVGVLPDTLSAEVAYDSSNDILTLLKEHGISDIDVAYRESVVRGLSGPELLAPVRDYYGDTLKPVIDPVTTALGLPIAGLKTLARQGTMGFYFGVGEDLYAVTARHILFPEDEGNDAYSYIAGPQKKVVLMGTKAFADFLASIQRLLRHKNTSVRIPEWHAAELTETSEGGGPEAEQAARSLAETQRELTKTRTAIEDLKTFYVEMKTQWTNPKDRVIGHVVWAPAVNVSPAPHSYAKDICVVKLDKKKFLKNFRGNVLDLGPDIEAYKFISLMRTCRDAPFVDGNPTAWKDSSDFDYPRNRLLKLQGILSAEEMHTPDGNNSGEPMRYVIKHGSTARTTIGCLNGFESHVRRYTALGTRDSVEAAVYSYGTYCHSFYNHEDYRPFSEAGDSGSIILDAHGKAAALLTSGTGPAHSPDIAYGVPMHWLWDIIKAQFPGANLYFDA